jgi:hypothetical protein
MNMWLIFVGEALIFVDGMASPTNIRWQGWCGTARLGGSGNPSFPFSCFWIGIQKILRYWTVTPSPSPLPGAAVIRRARRPPLPFGPGNRRRPWTANASGPPRPEGAATTSSIIAVWPRWTPPPPVDRCRRAVHCCRLWTAAPRGRHCLLVMPRGGHRCCRPWTTAASATTPCPMKKKKLDSNLF